MKGIEQFLQVDAATLGALKYAGTWNASTNTPTLASGVGVQGQYYVVSVAGSTNLDGETNWQVGDWAVFNGSVWQKVDGGSTSLLTTLTVTGNTYLATTSGNVGIGTSSPAVKFEVYDATTSELRVTNSTQGFQIYTQALATTLGTYTNIPLILRTNATEAMRITSAGDVGIGTSSPGYKLTVAGASGSAVVSLLETGVRSWGIRAGGVTTNTFDIADFTAGVSRLTLDASGNLGLGVTPSAWVANAKALQIGVFPALWQGSNGATQIGFGVYEGGINTYNYSTTGDLPTMYRQLTGAHAWYSAGAGTAGNAISFTQAMTLDASGDLIVGGTTTNSIRLTAEKSNPTRGIIAHVVNSGSSSLTGSQIMFTQNTVNNWAVGQPAGVDAFAFWSGRNTAADGTERMRIDSSGNLGLGVTPKTWSTGSTIEVGNYFLKLSGSTTYGAVVLNNAYYNGGWKFAEANWANMYQTVGGVHSWHTSTAAGTAAGDAITFTQAMTLDASGNLGVGTSSPGARLHINSGGVDEVARFEGSGEPFISLYDNGVRDFYLFDSTEIRLWGQANKAMVFATNNTERARIDSSGNLLVGTTTNTYSSKLVSNSGITDFGSQYNVDTSSGDYQFVQRAANRGLAFYVNAAGTIATLSSAGVWTDASDVRYKENVQPTRYGLDAVMQLKPREYNLIGQSKKQVGFIAQEVLDVVPEVVDSVVNSITNEDRYTLSYGQMTAVLTKAIQELKAQNDELRARVAALETK